MEPSFNEQDYIYQPKTRFSELPIKEGGPNPYTRNISKSFVRQQTAKEWLDRLDTDGSGVSRMQRKQFGDKLLLSYDFNTDYMFKESDLDNTDWWALCHDPRKSV